jgi:hypothetical protein
VLDVVIPDDDGMPTHFRQVVDIAAGESRRFTAYARAGTIDAEIEARVFDERGRRQGSAIKGSGPGLTVIMPSESLLVALGKPQGVEMIPGFLSGQREGTEGTKPVGASNESGVEVARVGGGLGEHWPGSWMGYDAAEAIVIDTNDREVMATLNTPRGQALGEWVRRGGHLVVAVGASWQQVKDSTLGPLLPGVPSGRETVNDLGALETYAGATRPITPPGTKVEVTKLDDIEARGGRVLTPGVIPLVVRGPYGFGRVTVVALDVDQRPFADWPDRPLFWTKAIDLRRQSAETATSNRMVGGPRGRIYQSGISDLSTQLRKSLEQFPGIRLVPFGWVAFFIFLYILLIGPGDYLFLKKVVKRMELTWITFPAIVVAVSLLAYYAAYLIKGNELRVNKVDVVDIDQPSGVVRGHSWLNIFSPQNRDYNVSVVPAPLDRPVDSGAAATPARPPAGTETVLTWFSVPEVEFGGMGGSNRFSFAGGGYAYEPLGRTESLDGVRVAIWSTKCLSARWFGPAPSAGVVESDLIPVGADRLNGTVTNRLSVPLHDALLAFGKQVYLLEKIAAGETKRVELVRENRSLSGYIKSRRPEYMPEQPWNNTGTNISRPDLLLALMFHDSIGTLANETPVASRALHGLDLSGQLALERPMLIARVEDLPGSRLVLGNVTSEPKINQTTLFRVILPLGGKEGKPAGGLGVPSSHPSSSE